MNINNNNYQEALLLYVDGALQPSQMDAVDAFVAENNLAKIELELLLDTKLNSLNNAPVVFLQKETLFKYEEDAINQHNYPAYFIEYIHNELDPKNRLAVEAFVKNTPTLTKEFSLYTQTIVEPNNAIVFSNKDVLFRKENRKPIVYFNWRYMSAAAVFIGFMLVSFFVLNNKNEVKVAKKTTDLLNTNTKSNNVNDDELREVVVQKNVLTNNNPLNNNSAEIDNTPKTSTLPIQKEDKGIKGSTAKKTSVPNTYNTQEKQLLTNTATLAVDIRANNNTKIAPIKPEKNGILDASLINESTMPNSITIIPKVEENNATDVVTNKNVLHKVVFKTIDLNNENDNTVYVANLSLNKQKINKLVSKIGKVFGKSKKSTLEDMPTSTASL